MTLTFEFRLLPFKLLSNGPRTSKMLKPWLAGAFLASLHGSAFVAADEWDSHVDAIMANFTTLDIVGQMTQIAAYGIVNSTYQLDEGATREY